MSSKVVSIDRLHYLRLSAFCLSMVMVIGYVVALGVSYYPLPLTERPFSELHRELRPAGTIGIRLGLLSGVLFLCLFLYPLRKHWSWLGRIGKTRNWFDFHIMLGLLVPVLVTLHASFKLHGLAGLAYWIMWAIVLSGIAGRYLYAQIPRSKNTAELTLGELQDLTEGLGTELERQSIVPENEWRALLAVPDKDRVEGMPLYQAILLMIVLDIRRPFRTAALRRHALSGSAVYTTLGGWLPSGNKELERIISSVRRQAWLTAKIRFLSRAADVFKLWHVVHRPFSYSFAILVIAHITLVAMMGYL